MVASGPADADSEAVFWHSDDLVENLEEDVPGGNDADNARDLVRGQEDALQLRGDQAQG